MTLLKIGHPLNVNTRSVSRLRCINEILDNFTNSNKKHSFICMSTNSTDFIKGLNEALGPSYFQQRAPRPPLSKVIPATRDH